ncbi:large ribosomal subunit protein uL22 [Desulfobacterium sp. N47]|uniref:Large ribosomal subunit protein uL22 n=1 Tax=uncultured Desulfobacterium sp. TaxID=201089 RepID=E1YG84_9BACT|nr:50S ribosomal protein L22 [uncultured Desulfobacterium sp.]
MEVKTLARYMRISPQKVRKLIGAVKGKKVETALNELKFMPQKSAGIVEKIIRSAVANANQNPNIDVDSMVVRNIVADTGPTLKRFAARARGRGTRIIKRTTHITVTLGDSLS